MKPDCSGLLYALTLALIAASNAWGQDVNNGNISSWKHSTAPVQAVLVQNPQSPPRVSWTLALHGTAEFSEKGSAVSRKGTGRMPRVIRGVSSDGDEGVFISGSFFGRSSLGTIESVSAGAADVLVGRIDKHGRPLWYRRFGSSTTDIAPDVTVDSQGRGLVTGMSGNGTQFDAYAIATEGRSDAFTAQLNPDGKVLWVRTIGGPAHDSGNEIATDNNDNVLVAGNSYGAIITGDTTLPHGGGMDAFVLKYTPDGRLLWARQLAGKANEQARGITADHNGNVIVVGEFTGTIQLDTANLTAVSEQRDIFVAKYNPDGELLWARRYGSKGEDYARGVDSDAAGNLYIAGVFSGQVEFGRVSLQGSGGREQLFLTRLSPTGEVVWARGMTGNGQGHGCEIDVTDEGSSVISCDIIGELQIDGFRIASAGRRDSFVARFNSSGEPMWFTPLGSSDSAANFDVALDRSGNLVSVAGVFKGSLGSSTHQLDSLNELSAYLVQLTPSDGHYEIYTQAPPHRSTARAILEYPDSISRNDIGRLHLTKPDPSYHGAESGLYHVEELTVTIPGDRWQQQMEVRLYVPREDGPFPIIIFCAGSGGRNDTYQLTSRFLASYGYAVLHTSYVRQRGLGNSELTRNRILDIKLSLDSLDLVKKLQPALGGKLDTNRIGAMGHSSGAYITQLLGGATVSWNGQEHSFREPRISAILMYSGQGSGQQGLTRESWRDIHIPMMIMTGTRDRGAFRQDPSWRREPFELSPAGDKYLLWYERGHHGSFSGKFARGPGSRALFEHAQQMTLAFFDAYLKESKTAQEILDSPTPLTLNTAEVEYLRR